MQKRGGNLIGFSFNGISSSTYGIVAKSINRPILPILRKRELVIPGRHGAYNFGDNTFENKIIEVELKYIGTSFTELRTRARTIAAWLSGYGGTKTLIFDDELDKTYTATIYNEVGLQNLFTVGQCTVQFECEPFAYGPEIIASQEMYSGNSTLSITSNGTIETAPIIEIEGRSLYTYSATFTRNSSAYGQDGTLVNSGLPRYENGYFHNLLTDNQASVETDTTGLNTGGSRIYSATLSRDTVEKYQGNASLKVVCPGSLAGEGFYTTGVSSKNLTNTKQIKIKGSGTVIAMLNAWDKSQRVAQLVTLTNNWQLVTLTLTTTTVSNDLEIIVYTNTGQAAQAVTFWVDALQIEEGSVAKSWILPSLGKGIMIEEGTIPLLSANQSSVEADTTGFSTAAAWLIDTGATISRDITEYWTGTASLKCISPGTNTYQGFETTGVSASANTACTVSAYVKAPLGANLVLRARDYTNLGNTADTAFVGTGAWQRVTVSITTGALAVTDLRLAVAVPAATAVTFYTDGLQIASKAYATSWQIGGTARAAETLAIPTAGVLSPTQGTWEQMTYFIPSMKRTTEYPFITHIPRVAGATYGGILFMHHPTTSNWRLMVENDSAGQMVTDFAESLITDGWHRIGITWNSSSAKIFIDGVLRGTINNPSMPSAFHTVAYIGSYNAGNYNCNTLHDDLCISSIARTDAVMVSRGTSVSPLPVDADTTGKMDCDGNLTIYGAVPGVTTATETLTTNPTITIGTASITYSGTLTYDEKLTIDNDKLTMYIGAVNALGSQSGSFLSLSTGANTVAYSDVGSNRANVTVTYADRWL